MRRYSAPCCQCRMSCKYIKCEKIILCKIAGIMGANVPYFYKWIKRDTGVQAWDGYLSGVSAVASVVA